jgi:maltose O-acetyltransferase
MSQDQKDETLEYYDMVPPKNMLLQLLTFMRTPLLFPPGVWLVKKLLKHCKNVELVYGFRCLYGNIYGKNVVLGDTFFVDYAPIYLGDNCRFSFDNIVITSIHDRKDFLRVFAKPIHIGKNTWITSRCVILSGVHIGDNCVIGAGSVVTTDIPDNCFAAGNPAKVIKKFED